MADFDGDGIIDLLSGSHCCAVFDFHFLKGRGDGLFEDVQTIQFKPEEDNGLLMLSRERTRPHIFDWNRDGKDDLIFAYRDVRVDSNLHKFDLSAWLKAVEKAKQAKVQHDETAANHLHAVKVEFPELERLKHQDDKQNSDTVSQKNGVRIHRSTMPRHYQFDDWDGDGNFDLLVLLQSHFSLQQLAPKTEAEAETSQEAETVQRPETRYSIVWLRNMTSSGEPKFGPAQLLYQTHGSSVLQSFTVVDFNNDGSNEIVATVARVDLENNWQVQEIQLQLLAKP